MFNKALFKKEWKTLKWITLFYLIGFLFIKVYKLYLALNNYINLQLKFEFPVDPYELIIIFNDHVFMSQPYETVFSILVIIFITIVLFYDSRNTNYSMLASMPFNRKEIIITKLVIGALSIIVVVSIIFAFLSGIYFAYVHEAYDRVMLYYHHLIRWYTMNIFVYLTVFSLAMMIQSLLGNQVLAGVVSGIMLFFPVGFLGMLEELLRRLFNYKNFRLYYIGDNITFINYIYSYSIKYTNQMMITLALTVIFVVVCYFAYLHNHLEKNGQFVMFKPLENIFVIGFSLSFGMLVAILGVGFNYYMTDTRITHTIILLLLGIVSGYILSKLLLKFTTKRTLK